MRIYNGKSSQVDLPLSGNTRLTIAPHSVSREIMPSEEFLTMIAQNYEEKDLALIVAGPFEINMCAHNPASSSMVVESLDEAIARFSNTTKNVEEPKVVEEKAQCPMPKEEETKAEECCEKQVEEKKPVKKVKTISFKTKKSK